jgi:hypothetical protein
VVKSGIEENVSVKLIIKSEEQVTPAEREAWRQFWARLFKAQSEVRDER